MNEVHKIWLETLYENEIEDTKATIENEKLWLLGSDTEEDKFMHEQNIEELISYIELLEELKKGVQ